MDHERQARVSSGLDMRLKALALRAAVRLVVIIIKTALADRDHARVVCALFERLAAKVGMSIRLVRVDANARPDVGVTFSDRNNVVPLPLPRRDVEKSMDAALACIFQHLVLAFDQSF